MKNSKLIRVLAHLDVEEFLSFGEFLTSTYFQSSSATGQQLIRLFEILHPAHPLFEATSLSKESIYEQIYENEEFVAGRMEKLMSALFKQLEEFVYIQSCRNSPDFYRRQSLIEFYAKKRLAQLQTNAIEKQQAESKAQEVKNNDDLYRDYILQQSITNLKLLSDSRDSDLNLSQTIQALDNFYLSSRLEYTCNFLAQQRFHNIFDTHNLSWILELLKPVLQDPVMLELPQIQVYVVVYKILKEDNKDVALTLADIQHLENLLQKFNKKLPASQLRGLHTFNRSLLMRVLNLGKLEYTQVAFDIYKLHLKSGVIFNNGRLHQGNYKNIASIGIELKEFKWVDVFLKKYKNLVLGKDPEAAYQFNLANSLFHQGKIEAAYDMLPQHIEDLYYRLAAKRLEIKILYNTDQDLMEYKIKAFNQYIYRISNTLLPEVARAANKNFAKLLLRILKPSNIDPKKKAKIRDRILALESVKEKAWLLGVLG